MCEHREWINLSSVCRECKSCGTVQILDPCDNKWHSLYYYRNKIKNG
jgi:hypothetical protein